MELKRRAGRVVDRGSLENCCPAGVHSPQVNFCYVLIFNIPDLKVGVKNERGFEAHDTFNKRLYRSLRRIQHPNNSDDVIFLAFHKMITRRKNNFPFTNPWHKCQGY